MLAHNTRRKKARQTAIKHYLNNTSRAPKSYKIRKV